MTLHPSLLSALWTRHLLHLISGSISLALNDLHTIAMTTITMTTTTDTSHDTDATTELVFKALLAITHHNHTLSPSDALNAITKVCGLHGNCYYNND